MKNRTGTRAQAEEAFLPDELLWAAGGHASDIVLTERVTGVDQTGQAIEIIGITMGVYLLISLVTSAIMSFYGWRISRSLEA